MNNISKQLIVMLFIIKLIFLMGCSNIIEQDSFKDKNNEVIQKSESLDNNLKYSLNKLIGNHNEK
tara:strand:+ start:433 stop:627 length:195 start_codon:yes stop_codon:yes gene_type:complete